MAKKPLDLKTQKLLSKYRFPMDKEARRKLGKHINPLEPLLTEKERLVLKSAVSNHVPLGPGVNKDLLNDYKWKAGSQDKPEAIKAAHEKAHRIAPAYNKGPLTYMTDSALTPGNIDKAGKI